MSSFGPKATEIHVRSHVGTQKAWPPCAAVQRAAGPEGDTNFGVTSVAAPKAASSRTARYSSVARRRHGIRCPSIGCATRPLAWGRPDLSRTGDLGAGDVADLRRL